MTPHMSQQKCPHFSSCPELREVSDIVARLEVKLDNLSNEVSRLSQALYGDGLHERSIIAKVNILWYSMIVGLGLLLGGGFLKFIQTLMPLG